jgi:hypothetical protein
LENTSEKAVRRIVDIAKLIKNSTLYFESWLTRLSFDWNDQYLFNKKLIQNPRNIPKAFAINLEEIVKSKLNKVYSDINANKPVTIYFLNCFIEFSVKNGERKGSFFNFSII